MSDSFFRDWVSSAPGARFRPAAGRYHLYVMVGCPWAQRALIVHSLKGLGHAIGVTLMHHRLVEGEGWVFAPERPDPLYGAKRLRELYEMAQPGYAGRITVPVLWDKQECTIVNNESADIVRMFGSAFDAHAERPGLDLYPPAQRAAIDRWNERIQKDVNVGVYRAGMAATQFDYDLAVAAFFDTLDELDAHLARHRYLAGPQPTEADWRLLPTLLRFEWVYHTLFKCNLRRLIDYKHLFAYARELFQWSGVAGTVDEALTRDGYFWSLRRLNPSGIVPIGSRVAFGAPHGRERIGR